METPSLPLRELPGEEQDLGHKRGVKRGLASITRGGQVNWVVEGTLATGATSTTFTLDSVTSKSQVSMHPLTPEAAAIQPKCWITAAGLVPGTAFTTSSVGQFTVQHPALLGGVVATFRFSVKG